MENLNAEQIIQGLRENDSSYKDDQDNIRDAIALIKSQEKRIRALTEENERLKNICNSYALQYGTARDKEVFLRKEREDTVREFAERLLRINQHLIITPREIEQVAKDILGKRKEEN